MLISKKRLIEIINNQLADEIELEMEIIDPGNHFDLPDMRFGAIYPPIPGQKITVDEKEKVEIRIRTELR